MNLLIDTHILLWWLGQQEKLTVNIFHTIENTKNNIFVSTAVIWEIAIKKRIGKLRAPDNLPDVLNENNFIPLSITIDHVLTMERLPDIHNDPFDRIQIAQATYEQMIFITMDQTIRKYNVNIFES